MAPDGAGPGADRLHDAELRDLPGEQGVEHGRHQDRAEQQRRGPTGHQRQQQHVGLPLVRMRVRLGHLDLGDRQPLLAPQPFTDVGGDRHHAVACPPFRVGDLHFDLVERQRDGRHRDVAAAALLLG
ncbi:hypothetical protein ACIBI7_29495 [Nonomuraea fuscirosea]|uniref:hypothetical protein n=1 Tax=Nonomuraea fuscirosea TaxID=1291556 RepID=UPI00378D93FF